MLTIVLRLACAMVALGASASCGSRESTVGVRFERDACVLRPGLLEQFGPPPTDEERQIIEQVARLEILRAFAPVRLAVSGDDKAFWRIGVVRSLPNRTTRTLPRAGESVALGMLGGGGTVACDVVARKAVTFAPAGTTRAAVIKAIGRGVGRTAVHELVHQLLGPSSGHNDEDADSYEYGSSDRASQYYGELHWTTALPLLQRKLGVRAARSTPG